MADAKYDIVITHTLKGDGAQKAKQELKNLGDELHRTAAEADRAADSVERVGKTKIDGNSSASALSGLKAFAGELPVVGGLMSKLSHPAMAAAAAVTTLGAAFAALVSKGIAFNSTMEQAQLGVASVLDTFDKTGDLGGFSGSIDVSAASLEELRKAAVDSPATFEELVEGFQGTASAAASAGLSIRQHIDLVTQMSMAVKAMGINGSGQLQQEMSSILTGEIDINSQAAKRLGITRQQIESAREQGRVYEFLSTKFQAFGRAGEEVNKTFSGALSRSSDLITSISSKLASPFFEALKNGTQGINNVLEVVDKWTGGAAKVSDEAKAKIDAARPSVEKAVTVVTNLSTGLQELGRQNVSMEQPKSEADKLEEAYKRASQAAKDLWIANERLKDADFAAALTDLQGKEDSAIEEARRRGATPQEEAAIRAEYAVERTNLQGNRDTEKADAAAALARQEVENKEVEIAVAAKRRQEARQKAETARQAAQRARDAAPTIGQKSKRELDFQTISSVSATDGVTGPDGIPISNTIDPKLESMLQDYAGSSQQAQNYFRTRGQDTDEAREAWSAAVVYLGQLRQWLEKKVAEDISLTDAATKSDQLAGEAASKEAETSRDLDKTDPSLLKEHSASQQSLQAAERDAATARKKAAQANEKAAKEAARTNTASSNALADRGADHRIKIIDAELGQEGLTSTRKVELEAEKKRLEDEKLGRSTLNKREVEMGRELRAKQEQAQRANENRRIRKAELEGVIKDADGKDTPQARAAQAELNSMGKQDAASSASSVANADRLQALHAADQSRQGNTAPVISQANDLTQGTAGRSGTLISEANKLVRSDAAALKDGVHSGEIEALQESLASLVELLKRMGVGESAPKMKEIRKLQAEIQRLDSATKTNRPGA
jgi:hypothetical protein